MKFPLFCMLYLIMSIVYVETFKLVRAPGYIVKLIIRDKDFFVARVMMSG